MRLSALLLVVGLHGATAAPTADLRPVLTAEQAAQHQVADYLAQGPAHWQPPALQVKAWKPDFVVAADGSGTHRSVQAAVDAVPDQSGTESPPRRWFIQLKPGHYREPVCIRSKPPLALYGEPSDAAAVTIEGSRYNGLAKPADAPAHPCHPNLGQATHGTSGSATMVVASDDVQLAHLSVQNKAGEGLKLTEGMQAVALMTRADKVQLENVRLLSHQDTFYVKRPNPEAPARVFVRASLIAGDVDFVFGNATLVVDDSTLLTRTDRLPAGRGGPVLAPSTPQQAALGFLVLRSRFVAEPGAEPGRSSLGRAWDEGVPVGQWRAGQSPNGQALVRDSGLGPHIGAWAASTAGRPFRAIASADDKIGNRLAEFNNAPLPAGTMREMLLPGEGWASLGPGTRGGADAAASDIHVVRNRKELLQALAPHARPRIVQLVGQIDLSESDDGRRLGAADFKHPDFSWEAFATAYDPKTWGRQAPEGPLEQARKASAKAQAAHVVLKVPSRTTLIGMGPGAHLVRGGLFLEQVSDIIIRNIRFSDAYDHFPAWDPQDNGHGEWNSEYDGLVIKGTQRVWIDHCTFDDGDHSQLEEPELLGRRMQRHDGLLDITRGSDLITISWSHFRHHDKTSLVGGSDKHLGDEGLLRVTYHHNRWEQTRERSPRVRFGAVQVVNNLYEVHDADNFGYSLGLGYRSKVLSQSNAWHTPAALGAERLLRLLGGKTFDDTGSVHNGHPVQLFEVVRLKDPSLSPIDPELRSQFPYSLPIDPADEVAARVRAGAGVGRLWTGPPIH